MISKRPRKIGSATSDPPSRTRRSCYFKITHVVHDETQFDRLLQSGTVLFGAEPAQNAPQAHLHVEQLRLHQLARRQQRADLLGYNRFAVHRPKPAEPHQHAHRKLNQAHSGKTGRFGAQSRQIDAGGKQNPLTGFAPSPTPSEDVIATAKDKTCLTATNIRSLKLPPGVTDKIFFDGDLPGFGLRIRASGAKTWMVQYAKGGRTRRMVLGPLEVLDPGKAREAAKDVLAKIRLGQDPVDDKRKARIKAGETFGVLLPKFLKHHASYTRARSHNIIKYYLTERVKLLNVFPVAEIDRRMISQCLSIVQETGPQARNNARRALSTFMTWAVKEGFIDSNPVLYTVVAKGNGKRERVLSDDELAQIWHALEQEPSKYHAFHDTRFRDIVRLLMLTGARRREISELEWEELNLKKAEITLPNLTESQSRGQRG